MKRNVAGLVALAVPQHALAARLGPWDARTGEGSNASPGV